MAQNFQIKTIGPHRGQKDIYKHCHVCEHQLFQTNVGKVIVHIVCLQKAIFVFTRYCVGTSVQGRLMRENIIIIKLRLISFAIRKDSPHWTQLQASFSPISRARIWPVVRQ